MPDISLWVLSSAFVTLLTLFIVIFYDNIKSFLTRPAMYVKLEDGTSIKPKFIDAPHTYECVLAAGKAMVGICFPKMPPAARLNSAMWNYDRHQANLIHYHLHQERTPAGGITMMLKYPLVCSDTDPPVIIRISDETRGPLHDYPEYYYKI